MICLGCGNELYSTADDYKQGLCSRCKVEAFNKRNAPPSGWQCPVCNSVWAPHISRCNNCTPP